MTTTASLSTEVASEMHVHHGQKKGLARWIVLAILLVFLAATLFPFLLAALNAIKTPTDYAANGPLALPHSFDLTALKNFWTTVDFTRKLFNSILISGCTAILAVVLSLLNAYAIGIGRVRGGKALLVVLLISIMAPQEALVYPLYYMAKQVGLFDSMLSVILIIGVLHTAFGTYLLSSVLTTFPREIIEAAQIDNASRWQILWMVIVPVLRPTLAVLATFFFIWTWNEFLIPLVFLVSNNNQTVSVAMGVLSGANTQDPTAIAAASLLGVTPTVIFFLIFQRTLTRGVAVGAVK
ncbi:carbohydrate ABC transporter permease [Rhizobium sp. LEGMi198b]|uniref:carbohydrate ABC transporter permease n=1 Tax=unclassified Rhizobium TaxID=2613769 RepID=UPI000CDF544B|nr:MULTISPECIES: carbohydrate ABC transporter permease [Rhizobium]AVA22545.1 sugar ABC transporter permease protein [Rhizobium sp. NXC24]MDK4738443.1 carbohydrate ABC transporter permease [Rhizobium sp. CNPSo 3464]UWU19933.1 carbohydrate ABC transporter permease [Rhizobium tropici]WFU00755.1 carbohydrate ABC transporter permease [Rhizobium sp. CB3171]